MKSSWEARPTVPYSSLRDTMASLEYFEISYDSVVFQEKLGVCAW